MKKQIKHLLIVIPINFILAGGVLLLCLLDPEFEPVLYYILPTVLEVLWAFFIAPSLIFSVCWAKERFERLNYEVAFRLGYLIGCSIVLLFIILIIISPVTGTLWYIEILKELKFSKTDGRTKKFDAENNDNNDDVFDI